MAHSVNLPHNKRQLQTNEYENDAIQDEGKRVPNCCSLKSYSRGHVGNTHAAHVHTASDHRDHAGNACPSTKQICCIRNENTDDDLDATIINPLLEPCHDRSHSQAYKYPSANQKDQTPNCLDYGWSPPRHQDQETKLQRYETCAVIYEALSFKNLDNPLRKANTPCDRGRSDSVCCRDHGTKENCGSPIEARQQFSGRQR